jgi:hypothetical protein
MAVEIIDQQYTGGNTDEYFGYSDKPGDSQGFTPTITGTITKFTVDLKKTGSPTGTVTCYLYSNNNGTPNAVVSNGTIGVLANSALGTGYASFDFTIAAASGPVVTAGTTYHMVLLNSTEDASNYVRIWASSTGNYTGGYACARNTAGVWTSLQSNVWDLDFDQYVTYTPSVAGVSSYRSLLGVGI